ncbi:hypothetical protein ADK67_00365 [Saccharothrix sp. NRRL B-16348]|uniref:hypothetical protein n=1 Tax=Saccharothrix sp. NRRL B-16348 TaxID=1415542 RepID=UPI0006AE7E03|nr:hypothetical protein [Saccharothrix sp. NRRL B-16348]KOX35033.1 hypothetical protein ADK67_00365 [Saccharothrix sp. NRRL B-16348]
MKALKACLAILAVGTLLVGCSADWEEEVRFKVTRITPERQVTPGHTSPPRAVMELDQDDPGALVKLDTASAELDQFPEGIKAGDVVICKVRQVEKNNLDGLEPESEVGPCRLA